MPDRRGWWIGGTADGEPFELIAWSRARTEERVAGILAAEIVDHIRIRTAEAIVHGLALRTSGRLAEWQERLRTLSRRAGGRDRARRDRCLDRADAPRDPCAAS